MQLHSACCLRGYPGKRSVKIGVDAIYNFKGYAELHEVHLFAFSDIHVDALTDIANEMSFNKKWDPALDLL